MPRTEAVVKSRGPPWRIPPPSAILFVFLVWNPWLFIQVANWLSVVEAGRQAKENVDAQFRAGAEYAKLSQQAEALGNWVEVGKVLSSGSPESWQELPVEVIQHLLVVALRWAEADGHDVEVPPPDMIARKNVLLKYQPLRLSGVVAWAWAGLRRRDSP